MTGDRSYFKLGVFVLGSIGVVIAGIIVLSSGILSGGATLTLETYVAGSVEGVQSGSAVHYRGIPVGSVQEVTLTADVYQSQLPFDERRPYVLLQFDVNTRTFGDVSRDAAHKLFADWVAEGLHVTREPRGLSGNAYLQLDFSSEAGADSAITFDWTPRYLYVPEAPGFTDRIATALRQVESTLHQIGSIDFAQAGQELQSILQDAQGAARDLKSLLGDPRLPRIVGDLSRTAGGLDSLVAAARPDVIAGAENLRHTARRLDAATADLPAAMADLNRSLAQLSSLLSSQGGNIAGVIRNLERAAANLRYLLEEAQRNPGGLLFGKPPPKVKP